MAWDLDALRAELEDEFAELGDDPLVRSSVAIAGAGLVRGFVGRTPEERRAALAPCGHCHQPIPPEEVAAKGPLPKYHRACKSAAKWKERKASHAGVACVRGCHRAPAPDSPYCAPCSKAQADRQADRRRRRPRPPVDLTPRSCMHCGGPFPEKATHRARFCGRRCAEAFDRAASRAAADASPLRLPRVGHLGRRSPGHPGGSRRKPGFPSPSQGAAMSAAESTGTSTIAPGQGAIW